MATTVLINFLESHTMYQTAGGVKKNTKKDFIRKSMYQPRPTDNQLVKGTLDRIRTELSELNCWLCTCVSTYMYYMICSCCPDSPRTRIMKYPIMLKEVKKKVNLLLRL